MRKRRYVGGYSVGTLDDEAHLHPFRIAGRHKNERGFPLGLDSHRLPRLFDAPWMRMNKQIGAPSMIVTGDVGCGKSTFAERVAMLSWMMNYRSGQRARVSADITKEGDHGDWIRMLGGEVHDLNARFKDGINILDPKLPLDVTDRMRIISMFARDLGNVQLTPEDQTYLLAGLTSVVDLKERGEPHISKLNDWANTVTYDEYTQLMHALNMLSEDVLPRVSPEQIQEATRRLSFVISNIIRGPHGRMLGGYGSLADILMQLIVSFDFTHLSPEAQPLLQAFLWQVKSAAAVTGDSRFITDIEIVDENMEHWYSWALAKSLQSRIKKLRSTGQLLILVSQHYSDYLSIGGDQGMLARNMLTDIGMHVAGRHEDAANIALLSEHGRFTPSEAETAMHLDPGSFVAKFGGQKAFTIDSPHIGFMPEVADTDRASRRNLEAIS